jgi:RNA polymerase sigma-70 factor, ECF subfamily
MYKVANNVPSGDARTLNQQLVARILANDPGAFGEVYARYSTRVFNICYGMVRDVAIAEDLTQDTFLQAFRKISSFRGDSLLSTWLHRIAVNTTLMFLRREKIRPFEYSLNDTVETEDGDRTERLIGRDDRDLCGAPDRVTLQRAVDSLPEGYRMIFMLHDVHGYEHHEIAEFLGCTIGNTKSQLHKARLKLRSLISKTNEDSIDSIAA